VATFEEFQTEFFRLFSGGNFYAGRSYLEYIAEPQTNDEDNIVDTKIVLPLLLALGFESGDIAKNTTASGKDNTRPDFQVKLASGSIRCFLVEDKHTAYDLSRPDPLQQLMSYAPSRGYELGLVCNGKLLLGWDLSHQGSPNPVLHLDIHQVIETGLDALTLEQVKALKGLHRRFHKQNFEDIETLIQRISKPENEWLDNAKNPVKNPDFDELLISDLKAAINLLEEDVLYQLDLLLEEYDQYSQAIYLPNGNGNSHSSSSSDIDLDEDETAPRVLTKLRKQILNYVRAYGVLEVDDFTWIDERIGDFAETSTGSIRELEQRILKRLMQAEQKKNIQQQKKRGKAEDTVQLDLMRPLSEAKRQELGIKLSAQPTIEKLEPKMIELLYEYERIVFDWKAWQAKQSLTHTNAIKTQQYFISWRNLVTKTVLQGADDRKLKEEFARQTAYVYVIRLLMVRICEDKKLLDRKFSDGGFRYWKEEVESRYLDLARGVSMDYLLEMSYRSAQSIYAHFFSSADLFNWYRMSTNTLIKVLEILNRFNLQQIDSDIIGMVYGRYVEEGKHEQGRYFTPKNVVEYILDSIGYKADNPDIRDKKLLDLAGGSGSFLVHAARRLIDSYRLPKTGKIPVENIPSIIRQVKESLFSLDINPFACYLAETNLLIQVIDLLKQAKDADDEARKRQEEPKYLLECTIDRFNVYNTDSLLLPRSQEIRTPLLNPILDLELSTVSQVKTKTGNFADGFDFVVGNPPYVKADEPGMDAYRREIENSGRFETLHEKWDLFVPFVELACKSAKRSGKIGLIVSRGFQTNPYAELLRDFLARRTNVLQVDFFNRVRLFTDAVVNNTIFFLDNVEPDENLTVKRVLHKEIFGNTEELVKLSQCLYGAKVFRQFLATETLENVIDIEEICYVTKAMALHAENGAFKKEDLISLIPTKTHIKKYLDGENLIREFAVHTLRYLEWNTSRVPNQISRKTIPELYDLPKIITGMTSYSTYDRGIEEGDGFYVPHSVYIAVRWDFVSGINRLEREPRQMYELSKKQQRILGEAKGKKIQVYKYAQQKANLARNFDLRYIAAVLNSSFGKTSLQLNNRDENIMSVARDGSLPKSRIYPDDIKEFPIKIIDLECQQPFVERVNHLIEWNWELTELNYLGDVVKFKHDDGEPVIHVEFLRVFKALNLSCWSFLNAEPQRFEVIGDRQQPITKIKIKNNKLLNGRDELLHSDSALVLAFLQHYLLQYEKRGLTWTDLLEEGRIPKTDEDIQRIFAERDRLAAEIRQKIEAIRRVYKELDEMVNQLYGIESAVESSASLMTVPIQPPENLTSEQ